MKIMDKDKLLKKILGESYDMHREGGMKILSYIEKYGLCEASVCRGNEVSRLNEAVRISMSTTLGELKVMGQNRVSSDKRMVIAYFCRSNICMTYDEIGEILGRSHATIIHHCKQAPFLVEHDREISTMFENLRESYYAV